jgi:hypothetical protein
VHIALITALLSSMQKRRPISVLSVVMVMMIYDNDYECGGDYGYDDA